MAACSFGFTDDKIGIAVTKGDYRIFTDVKRVKHALCFRRDMWIWLSELEWVWSDGIRHQPRQ